MNTTPIRWTLRAVIAMLLMALSGCVAEGGGMAVRYNADYYEPYGYDYGGLRPGYQVGPPPRGGYDYPVRSEPHPSPPAYHPAPSSHPTPSIPTRPHNGHSGGDGKDGKKDDKKDDKKKDDRKDDGKDH